jgi:deferrochelatase/peroxidase EfeB
MMLVAFDSLASDKADLERLFRLLTQRIAFLTRRPAPDTPNPRLPPMDSGILGPWIAPDNLTITVSVGHSLFDERFGLADSTEKAAKMTRFPNDSLDAALCHGDLLLQICANTQDTVIHALRDVIKHTPDLLSVRWKREGFISDSAARSKGKETPVNLLGFKDGTANPAARQALMVVWVTADQDEPVGRGRQLSGGAHYPVPRGVLGSHAAQRAADHFWSRQAQRCAAGHEARARCAGLQQRS